jgi:hypothetical protein
LTLRNVDLDAIKEMLPYVAGITGITQTNIGGRMTFGFNGIVVGVDPGASDDEIVASIQKAESARLSSAAPTPAQSQDKPMTTPAKGSFAASLKAMMDEARAGVAQARADGIAKVSEAVGKLNEAKTATAQVAGAMAKNISDEADSVLAELGQISNDLTGESS